MSSPDREVADKIINEFRSSRILTESGIAKIMKGLDDGKLSAEDWRLAFELDQESKEDEDASKS